MKKTNTYRTQEIHLCSLLLSKIENSSFTIENPDVPHKFLLFKYPQDKSRDLSRIIDSFKNKSAEVNLFQYNYYLFRVRNAIRGIDRRV